MNSVDIGDNLAIYGEKAVNYCLMNGLIETLIVHEDILFVAAKFGLSETDDIESLCIKFSTELIIITGFLPEANQIKIGFGVKWDY